MSEGERPETDASATEAEPPPSTCLNCRTLLQGRYCSTCGQQNRRSRLDVRDLVRDGLGQLVGLDTKIGRTLVDFSRRPGQAALAYVRGHRARYINPLKYLIFSVAAYFLALAWLDLTVSDLYQQAPPPATAAPEAAELVGAFQDIVNDSLRSLLFAAPPVFAWVTNFLLGRRRFNFAEGCSLWLFATAHSVLLITLPALLLSPRFGPIALYLAVIPSLLLYTWAARGFYGRGWIYSAFAVLVAYAIFQLVLVGTMIGSVVFALFLSRS